MGEPIRSIDPELRKFATPKQAAIIDAINRLGSLTKAAAFLAIGQSTATRAIQSVQSKAALQGYSPDYGWSKPVPEPHIVSGVSTLYDQDGQIRAQWVKTKLSEQNKLHLVQSFVDSIADEISGKSKPVAPPKHCDDDLLSVYPMGDPHIGMYAWDRETGENFDTEIASQDLRAAVASLVSKGPNSRQAVILPLGDYFHSDNYDGLTYRSGNRLDVDTRWPRVVELGAKLLIWCVEHALKKHKSVIVKPLSGNHDDHSAISLGLILQAYFRNDARVTVDTHPGAFWFYEFGRVLLGATHGHTVKPDQLPHIMAHDAAQEWGRTKYRYWYTGHIHTKNVMEWPGCSWESFRTLAAKDAWTAARGYRSGRDMNLIVHHKDFGEILRHRADIAMVRAGK